MFEDLGRVIEYLQIQYNDICNQWKQINGDNLINLKRKLVIDLRKNQEILNMIWEYRTILNDEILQIMFSLENIICKNSTVDSRVKAQNSIEYKIENLYVIMKMDEYQ